GRVGGDAVEPGDLALIFAVRIHHPDFFVAGTVAGEINMRAEEGLAAEQSNDVGGEFVRDLAGAGFIHCRQIALADELGVGRGILAQIVEPALQHQHPVLCGGVAEGEVVCLRGRAGPILHPTAPTGLWDDGLQWLFPSARRLYGGRRGPLEIGGLLRYESGERRLGDDFETAAGVDVAGKSFIEGRHELLGVTGTAEVRYRDGGDAAFGDDDYGVLRHENEQRSRRRGCEPDGLFHAWPPTVLTRRQTQSPPHSWETGAATGETARHP